MGGLFVVTLGHKARSNAQTLEIHSRMSPLVYCHPLRMARKGAYAP
jgi:hypothetical protein